MKACNKCKKKPTIKTILHIEAYLGEYNFDEILVEFKCDCGTIKLSQEKKMRMDDNKPVDDKGEVDIPLYKEQRAAILIKEWDESLYKINA